MLEIIPETHTLGSINPHTLFIDLNRASRAEILQARAGDGAPRGWELYEHEARHWRDMVATVWGRRYLDLLFRTYDALLATPQSRIETAYEVVLDLFDSDRAILFPSYYKYVLAEAHGASANERWAMGFSTGMKVASNGALDPTHPFIFVRFDAGRKHIARQPVSDGSLLETRALAAELAAAEEWLKMRPKGEDVVTWRLKEPELAAQFYNPELTTYSVAAHVIAFATGMPGARQALALGDKLADIALNLTEPGFIRLQPPEDLDPGHQRLLGFRQSQNRGYAFCCLAFALRPHVGRADIGRDAIERALRTAGLPSLGKIYADARSVMDQEPQRAASDPALASIRLKLLAAGRALYGEPDFEASVASLCPAGASPAPLVADSECETFSLGAAPLDLAESEFLFECHQRYRTVLRSALRAARGLEFEFTDYVY
jgi:hypothetical protein